MATKNAATFDGINDFLDLVAASDLSGNADSKLVSGSFWFKRATISTLQDVYHNSGERGLIQFRGSNKLGIEFKTSDNTRILNIDASATMTDTTSSHNALFSADMAVADENHLYIDDISDLVSSDHIDDTIDFTRNNHAIGAVVNGGAYFDGCLAEFWLAFGVFFDFSVESNRRKFISADLKAVDLGSDGSKPNGTAPIIYLANEFSTFQTNLGTGGGFTENSVLADCVGPESTITGFHAALFAHAQSQSTLLRM